MKTTVIDIFAFRSEIEKIVNAGFDYYSVEVYLNYEDKIRYSATVVGRAFSEGDTPEEVINDLKEQLQ